MADDLADPAGADHPVDLAEAGPLDTVGLSRLQHDILDMDCALQAVKVVKGILIPVRIQQLEFILPGLDAGLLEQLPGNGLTAGLPCLGSAAGIFPGAGKALSLCPAGQQDMAPSVVDPDAYHKAVLSGTPGGAPLMDFPGEVPVFIVDIIKLHGDSPFRKIPKPSIAQTLKNATLKTGALAQCH